MLSVGKKKASSKLAVVFRGFTVNTINEHTLFGTFMYLTAVKVVLLAVIYCQLQGTTYYLFINWLHPFLLHT